MNAIDQRTEEIEAEIHASFQNEEDSALRSAHELRAACFKIAVLESKLDANDNEDVAAFHKAGKKW